MSMAQQTPVAPQPAARVAYAKYKNKFYISGGSVETLRDPSATTNQFYALDLSKPWKSESPAWIRLPDAPRKDFAGAAMSSDGKIFMTFPSGIAPAHRFFFENNTWSESKAQFRASTNDVSPVTLGVDSKVLILRESQSNNVTFRSYDIYSFDTDQVMTTEMPFYTVNNTLMMSGPHGFKPAWSNHLKAAVFVGGIPENQWVNIYDPKGQWTYM
ncbi:hypothetical protein DFQ26_009909, partial [Actinomortierella ambigua]